MTEKILFKTDYSLDDLPLIASSLIKQGLFSYPLCILAGDLGAGKTTLVKSVIQSLDHPDQVTSPTFSLVNEYGPTENPIFHLDLYRLRSREEAIDIGFEEYLDKGFCFIEWSDLVIDLLPEKYCRIEIENLGNFTRCLQFKEVTI
jgi:tRNA threonylcarbamoyladenosine biosynthesis protein TsaE